MPLIIAKNYAKVLEEAEELKERYKLPTPENFQLEINALNQFLEDDTFPAGTYEDDKLTIYLKNHHDPFEFLETFVHLISHHYTKEETHSELYKDFAADLSAVL